MFMRLRACFSDEGFSRPEISEPVDPYGLAGRAWEIVLWVGSKQCAFLLPAAVYNCRNTGCKCQPLPVQSPRFPLSQNWDWTFDVILWRQTAGWTLLVITTKIVIVTRATTTIIIIIIFIGTHAFGAVALEFSGAWRSEGMDFLLELGRSLTDTAVDKLQTG